MPRTHLTVWAALIALALPSPTLAQAPASRDLDLPPPLEAWVGWVLHGSEEAFCTDLGPRTLCAWPSLLELDLNARGGRFRLDVYAEREGFVTLPGSAERWPQDVKLDGKPAVVLEGPRVQVPAGSHALTGTLVWPELPESLQTPPHAGQVKLRIDGQPVESPRHEEGGLLWLRGGQTRDDDTQRLDVEVSRRIEDGVPARIVTRLSLAVGGKTREAVIDGALLEGTRPLTLDSSLPVRLDPDGKLRVQVAPGEHRVELTALAPTPPDALKAPTPAGPWADREVWVFQADPTLREVELSGGAHVDPARTHLAPDWRDLPTYLLSPGEGLAFETKRRGEAQPSPNALDLQRDLWLDLDGGGYTVRDHIQGQMHRGWRLDLLSGELGRAAVHGQDQLVTLHEGARGLEVRDEHLDLLAEWRLPREGGALPAVGWSDDMGEVSTTLHLPPGWALLGGEGADTITGTLLDDWDLWSFFFVLLVALASFKLAGPLWGGIALVALTLTTHQPDAPGGVWLWLVAALALTRFSLPGVWGKGARVLLGLSLLSAVLTLIPFTVHQLRFALYPQVDEAPRMAPAWLQQTAGMPEDDGADFAEVMEEQAPMGVPAAEPMPPPSPDAPRGGGGRARTVSSSVSKLAYLLGDSDSDFDREVAKARLEAQQLDAGAVVQTGPGVPDWSWQAYRIVLSGPVQHAQQLELWLIPPWLGRLLAVLRVLLAGVLLLGLLRASRKTLTPGGGAGSGVKGAGAAAAAGLWVALTLPWGSVAHAQGMSAPPGAEIDPDILAELKRRLTEPPECAPECLSVSKLEVEVRGSELVLRSEVHVGARGGYRAPGPIASFTPREVRVDGWPAHGLARLDDGFLRVRLEPGRHVVELVGPFPASDELTLQLGTPPHHVRVDAPEYEVDGVRADGKAEGSIQLRRRVQRQGELEAGVELPPWLSVRRHFDIGSRFRVVTTVRRMGRSDAAVLLRFPLLPGESVTQTDMQEQDGKALLRLAPGQDELVFTTALKPREQIALSAPAASEAQPYSVVWEIACGTFHRCTAEGIAPVSRRSDGRYLPEYRPFPGESLNLKLERLAPAEGRSATIDRADLTLSPGQRLTSAQLALSVRSSTGTSLTLDVPPDAELASLHVDGQARAAQVKDGRLELALDPGSQQVAAELRIPQGLSAHYVTPAVSVGGELVNVRVRVEVPRDRWLLWAHGPDWGPAVLFWGVLAAFVVFAVVLSRIPGSPLRLHQWVLLALGLTQIPAPAAVLVVGWFFAVHARQQRPPAQAWLFNLAQIALVGLTVAAASTLIGAVHEGLVVRPDMQVAGGGSHDGELVWYVDRAAGGFPQPGMVSVPLWVYRALMLAWALWLASQSLRWLRMGWDAFSEGGRWKMLPRKAMGGARAAASAPVAAPAPSPAAEAGGEAEAADRGGDGGSGEADDGKPAEDGDPSNK